MLQRSSSSGGVDRASQETTTTEGESITIPSASSSEAVQKPAADHLSDLLDVALANSRPLSKEEIYLLLTTNQANNLHADLDVQYYNVEGGKKRKQITFQKSWLNHNSWLRYGSSEGNKGGWCIHCALFLTAGEKLSYGVFVRTPFVSYQKSSEMFEKHCKSKHHLKAVDQAYYFKETYYNPAKRVDTQISAERGKNFKFNSEILPIIVEAVITCGQQRMALQGHHQDKIDFSSQPTSNEGNFVSIIRLLAKTNHVLMDHLISGPKNAKYVSKTIQNEILDIAADQIREFYRECIRRSPHFSVIADEVTSHGKEILAVCLRFLQVDHQNFSVKPHKHEVLLDFSFLTRITGESIAESILKVLHNHKIDVINCRGQAYDTTSSMSSSRTGVQTRIKECAPDADYQGCCLHSLNLVICNSTKISAVRNMFDSCQQAFLFFKNSPKRQRFLEHIINCTCPETRKKKINGLCKTRWVERHNTFSTILELYTFLVKTWDEICIPSDDEQIYKDGNWNWDADSRSTANGLRRTFTSFDHIVAFTLSKEILEPMRPIAESLQGRLQEVYFGFKKDDEVTKFYHHLRENVDAEHSRVYAKAKKLAADVGSKEEMPRVVSGRQTRANPSVSCPTDYWRVTITIPFLDSIIIELESRFSPEKRAHYELCSLIPQVVKNKELTELSGILSTKWSHLLPSVDNLDSELHRWKQHCNSITEEKSLTTLLSEDADPFFFPNIRELLCILSVLPIGSTEAERSFSCLRQIHTWLRSTMTEERLGNLGVIALHGFTYPIDISKVCTVFMQKHPRRMSNSSVLFSD